MAKVNPVFDAMQKRWGRKRAIRMYFAPFPGNTKPATKPPKPKESRVEPGNRNP